MRLWTLLLVLAIGCKKGKGEDTAEDVPRVAPGACVSGDEVCATFSVEWSQDDADALCAELGGEPGECPEEELGSCHFEDGLQYFLYGMTPRDAEAYCSYLGGEWLEPGEELESEP